MVPTQGLDSSDFSLLTRMSLHPEVPVSAAAPPCSTPVDRTRGGGAAFCCGEGRKAAVAEEEGEMLVDGDAAFSSSTSSTSPASVGGGGGVNVGDLPVRPSPFMAASLPCTTSARGIRRSTQVPALIVNREVTRYQCVAPVMVPVGRQFSHGRTDFLTRSEASVAKACSPTARSA